MSRAAAWRRAGFVLAIVVAADQLAKQLVIASVTPGDSNAVLPGVEIVRVRNHGVAFGALSGGHAIVVIAVGVALAGLIAYFARHADRPLAWLPTGLLLGGALGNVIDRVRDGAVTDFIKLPLWPAFNIADIAITAGVLALLYVLEGGGSGDARPA